MRTAMAQTWVVYSMPMKNCPDGMRAVCEQREWEAMERAKPGFYTLIKADIGNEGEAERLARGSSGETPPRNSKRVMTTWPDKIAPVAPVADKPAAG